MTFKGISCDLQMEMGGFSVAGSGFVAKGINPFFTNSAGKIALREVDSRGVLLQGSYSWGKNRLALSYGKTVDDGNGLGSTADCESRGTVYFRTINDNLKPATELDRYRIDGRDDVALDEDTGTVALGTILNW